MAAAKKQTKSTKKTGQTSKKKNVRQAEPQNDFIRAEVYIILTFAVALLLFLSNFHLCGIAGDFLRNLQLGIFGMVGYVAPLLLFVGTCFYLSNRGSRTAMIKMVSVAAAILTLCGFSQLLFGIHMTDGIKLMDFYRASAESGLGGGWLGGVLVFALTRAIGTVGAYLVLAVCLIISMVCITERSFVNVVKKGGDVAYRHAKEDMDRRRELHAQQQEERRRLREEQRVRGVDLGSTRIEEPEDVPEIDDELPPEAGAGQEFYDDPEFLFAGNHTYPDPDRYRGAAGAASGAVSGARAATAGAAGVATAGTAAFAGTAGVAAEMRTVAAAETMASPVMMASPDDFVGSIALPPEYEYGYDDDDDDVVPFDADAIYTIPESTASNDAASYGAASFDAASHGAGDGSVVTEDAGFEGISGEEFATATVTADTFEIPEAAKQVVTASGKVIDTDTEALKKKLDQKRKEREESGDMSIQETIKKEEETPKPPYVFPPLSLLKRGTRVTGAASDKEYKQTAIKLQQTLRSFGVGVTVTNISCGPAVTRYELHPDQGVKVKTIVSLADDIKMSLAAEDIRIEAPIPGKSAVGIEVPNKENNMVYLRDLFESEAFKTHKSNVAFAVGKDIAGQVVVTDIAKMPHLLIAGATGSGKSVCINTIIMSIIYKAKPEDVKMIMVDPKVVELSVYNGIPHLLTPVVTDPKRAAGALNWAVAEMESRYKKFAEYNVRDLKGYNAKVDGLTGVPEEQKPQKLPQIVIIVDELADLMMVSAKEVEDAICRLAQLARAAGMHLVIATQRPSVNVITGLIKANVPSRIAFAVSSGVDSRTIIDINGAEKLLGKGDMLFYPAGFPKPQRVQGAFVSDNEVQAVVDFLTDQGMKPEYDQAVETRMNTAPAAEEPGKPGGSRDEYFGQAGLIVIEKEKASIGMLQRVFKIGFNRAARIMDQLSEAGVVGEEEGTKPRKVLMTKEEFEELLENDQ